MNLNPVVVLALLVCGALAWDCGGHVITARIAERLLDGTPQLAYFQDIGRFHLSHYQKLSSFNEIACWADDVKSFAVGEYNELHYINNCFNPKKEVNCISAPTPNLQSALDASSKKIAQKGVQLAEQSSWLAFIIHFVGDAHQPLHHCSLFNKQFPQGDFLGTKFVVKFRGGDVKLHGFYDSVAGLIPRGMPLRPMDAHSGSQQEMSDMADMLLATEHVDETQSRDLNVTHWLTEGFQSCTRDCYVDGELQFNTSLSAEYIENAQRIAKRQLVLGGYRLSFLLTELYKNMK